MAKFPKQTTEMIKMNETMSTRKLTACAMIAAIYTALCLALGSFSYGPVQIRVAEALTLLPVFSPVAVWGVTLGCALSNLFGFITGMNILGYLDILFGTIATLVAAIVSRRLRNMRFFGLPILAAFPPILLNALVIGAELTWLETGYLMPQVFLVNALNVGAGQAVSCLLVGLPMVWALERSGADNLLRSWAR